MTFIDPERLNSTLAIFLELALLCTDNFLHVKINANVSIGRKCMLMLYSASRTIKYSKS